MKKYTLMELMVVISVIMLLLSLLAPAIGKALSYSRSADCKNNLRSIGKAAYNYTGDYDSYIFPASFGSTTNGYVNHWINYFIKDGITDKTFQCPGMADSKMFDPAGHDPETGNIYTKASYVMNIIPPSQWGGAVLASSPEYTAGWGINSITPINTKLVSAPESSILITDAKEGISNSHSGINTFQRTDHGPINLPPTGQSRWVGNHHSLGFNALFGDGHVEYMKKSLPEMWIAIENIDL